MHFLSKASPVKSQSMNVKKTSATPTPPEASERSRGQESMRGTAAIDAQTHMKSRFTIDSYCSLLLLLCIYFYLAFFRGGSVFVTYLDAVTHRKKRNTNRGMFKDTQREPAVSAALFSSSEVNTHTNSIGRHRAKFIRPITEYSRAN